MKPSDYYHRVWQYVKYLITAKDIYAIHSPFVYKLVRDCFNKQNHFYIFDELLEVRQELLKDNTIIEYTNIGASSTALSNQAQVKDIVKIATTPTQYSELYFRMIQFFQSKQILELGTSVGLNTMYLAQATQGKVISIEGQYQLYQYAKHLLEKKHIHRVELICAYFDDVLSNLCKIHQWDFVLIDGNHHYDATMRYFEIVKRAMHTQSVIVIDDIYWSKAMSRAWHEIKHHQDVKISIDLYRCGIIIFNPDIIYPYHFVLRY